MAMHAHWTRVHTPIGSLGIVAGPDALIAILFEHEFDGRDGPVAARLGIQPWPDESAITRETRHQILEYFSGVRTRFDLPVTPAGSGLDKAVWKRVSLIPFGHTQTYRDIACAVGRPTSSRAIGQANGRNPLPIVVPCHRVVGSSGDERGYAGGIETKRLLLAHEGAMPASDESWTAWGARIARRDPAIRIVPRSTGIYCRPTCRYTGRIRRIPTRFASADAARSAGFRACKVCDPG